MSELGLPPHAMSVASLFAGESAVVAEAVLSELRCDESELAPDELKAVNRAVASRKHEFMAGRVLARRAMTALHLDQQPVLSGADRAPIWPEGIVGSISHTKTYCAVVLAHARDVRAVGVDVEMANPIKEELWSRLCTPAERSWLRSLPADQAGLACTGLFSAKESIYKAQFPLTKSYLGYQAVEVQVDRAAQSWSAVFRQPSGDIFKVGDVLKGRLSSFGGLVATSVVVRHVR